MDAPIVLSRPVDKQYPISQRFGENPDSYRSTKGHSGIDFDTPDGTPVLAAADGIVEEAGLHKKSQADPGKGYGYYVRIQHTEKGWNTLYTQLRSGVTVKPGQDVRRGELIGYSGNSGQKGDRPRLHFELRAGASVTTAVDPELYLEEERSNPGLNLNQASSKPPITKMQSKVYPQKPPSIEPEIPPQSIAPERPTNFAETQKGDTRLRVAETARPWAMEIDGMVIPAGVPYGALNGKFNTTWFKEVGSANESAIHHLVARASRNQPGAVTSLELGEPLGRSVLPFGGDRPRRIFLASAAGSDKVANISRIPGIIRQVVDEADFMGVRKLAIPLVGSGGGGLDPLQVADAMLSTLMGEIHLGGIQEITLVTLLPEVVEAAKQKFNLSSSSQAQAPSTDEPAKEGTVPVENPQKPSNPEPESTPPPPGPERPANVVEYLKDTTRLRVAETARPWAMEIDALVIPAGTPFGTLGGKFTTAWFQEMGSENESAIRSLAKPTGNVQSDVVASFELAEPLGGSVLPFGGDRPRRVFLASATGPDDVKNISRIPGIIRQVVAQADGLGVRKLAIPLVGTGGRGLNPLRVADIMLTNLMGEINLGGIQEITLVTLLPEVVEAAKLTLNRYRNNQAQPLAADVAAKNDTLGIGSQVKALAETLVLRDMPAGIVVGILGSWGSGKTSVMSMIQDHVEKLLEKPHGKGWKEDAGDMQPSPYVGYVYPIWFNAWTYAKANLWASLMETIFTTLENLRAKEKDKSTDDSDMWSILRGRKKNEWMKLKWLEGKLAKTTLDSKSLALEYEHTAREELGKLDQTVAWNVFWDEVQQVTGKWVQNHLTSTLKKKGLEKDAVAATQELRSLTTILMRLVETARKNWKLILQWAAFTVILCLVFKLILALISPVLDHTLTWLTGLIPALLQPLRTVAGWFKQVDKSLEAYRKRSEQERQRLQGLANDKVQQRLAAEEGEISAILNDVSKTPDRIEIELAAKARVEVPAVRDKKGNVTQEKTVTYNLAAYQALVKLQEAKVEQQRKRAGMAGRFATLAEFLQSRLDSGFYEQQLGPMYQVEKDIADLTEGLVWDGKVNDPDEIKKMEAKKKVIAAIKDETARGRAMEAIKPEVEKMEAIAAREKEFKALFPKGPARVILFIDDLDRCPPPRVVEVLEAVQLLLKTPLFVVVLGLDTRYATRALEKEYKEILQHDGDPSGMDYIEKIIQIPYRVRPIERSGLAKFLIEQMDPLDVAPELEEIPDQGASAIVKETPAPDQSGPAKQEIPPAAGTAQDTQPTEPAPLATPASSEAVDQEEPASIEPPRSDEPAASAEAQQAAEFKELPPAVVRFSQEDFEDVKAVCGRIKLTPRSVKRLVNVMKLLEVFWFRTLGYDRERVVKQSVLALLTLAAAYPEVMVEVFTQMEPLFDDPEHQETSLGDHLGELKRESLRMTNSNRGVLNWQFERYLDDIKALRLTPMDKNKPGVDFLGITFKKMTVETFNLVRSFSFIGDPAYTLEEPGTEK